MLTKLMPIILFLQVLVASKCFGTTFELKTFVNCPKGLVVIDSSNNRDECHFNDKVQKTSCSQINRGQLKNIVLSRLNGVNEFRLKNVIEYLHSRSYRMKKSYIEGRDYCSLSVAIDALEKS